MLVELHRWFLFIQTQKHFRLQRKFKAVSVNFHCSCFWRHLWTEAAWAPPSPVIKILSTFVLEMLHIFICFSFFLTQVDSWIMRYCNHVWLCKINYYYYQSVCWLTTFLLPGYEFVFLFYVFLACHDHCHKCAGKQETVESSMLYTSSDCIQRMINSFWQNLNELLN